MNIGEAATRSGLPPKTIRYYEEIGLVNPARDTNGYRAFRESDVHKLSFLERARALGFTIGDCRALLSLWEDDSRASADVKAIAREHLAEIDAKISSLRQMRKTLDDLIGKCAGDDRPECPIIERFAHGAEPVTGTR